MKREYKIPKMKVRHVFTESLLQSMSGHTEGSDDKSSEDISDKGKKGDANTNDPNIPHSTAKPFNGWTYEDEW